MLVPALLALALALAGSPPSGGSPPPPAGTPPSGGMEASELVQAVRIEAERPERLEPFVGIVAGRPLDDDAVRRAVELIFATGQFEDVRVTLEREEGSPGVTVVFRPIPAPLFVGARLEGDRVLSPGALVRIARLRPGEAMWPSRLDRAGRDVAVALTRRGYLEALVEAQAVRVPAGADVLFRVHAGPRVRVGRAALDGDSGVQTLALDTLVSPRKGEVYRKERADSAREAMRRRLTRAGYWRAEVEAEETYDPGRGLMGLAFHVRPGPHMRLETRGATLPGGLLGQVRDLLREGGASTDALEAGAERIESLLRRQGHREADARATTEPRPSGEAVVYDVHPGPRALVASVTIRNADPALAEGLRTRPLQPLEDAALEDDVRTLVRRLEDLGHFEAAGEAEVADGGGDLPVAFVARPGPRAEVAAFTVEGPPLPPEDGDRGPRELVERPGLPYRARDLARDRDTLLAAWHRAGYLNAQVRPELEFSEARTEAKVSLVVEPGARTVVEHVVLAGLRETRDAVVDREIVLQPGEPFSFERVLESQRRLSALGIFERVGISELDPGNDGGRDVVVGVQEAPRTSFSWGVGYSEQDRVRGSVEVTRRNLAGMGRTVSVFARGSFRGSRFLLNLREPWLFGRRFDSFLTGFWEEETRPGYDFTRKGAIVQAGHRFEPHTTLVLRYLYQNTYVYDITIPPEQIDRQYSTYTASGPQATVLWDTRDDPLDPRRGHFLSVDLQASLPALGGTGFVKGFFQATKVQRIRDDLDFVVAGRLGLASTFGTTNPLLPLPERFFAGGAYGPRGFPEDGLGPQVLGTDGQLYPTGGNAVFIGDAELRYNLTRSFQIATFFDCGNVFPEIPDLRQADLRQTAGLGVRYRTPIGPVRLDWGYILTPVPGERTSHLHLTIGYAF